MPKIRAAPSKRQSSRQRHKVERKKREHKRDVRKAAKAMRKTGAGGAARRTKKQREMVRLALKVSNANADKEKILSQVLQARETARVMRAGRKHKAVEEGVVAQGGAGARSGAQQTTPASKEQASRTPVTPSQSTRQLLYIPASEANSFAVQFTRSLEELALPAVSQRAAGDVQELPCVVYIVTLDARFAVQCMPWMLLDALTDQARGYTGSRPVLLLLVLTKVDLVAAPALVSQLSLVAVSLQARYAAAGGVPTRSIKIAIAPFSAQFDCTSRHLCRVIGQFERSVSRRGAGGASNMEGKACCLVLGYPNTGRRTLCRALACEANQARVSLVPLRAAQLQLIKNVAKGGEDGAGEAQGDGEATVQVRFALPNAKSITLVQLAEDERLRGELQNVTGAEVFFRSLLSLERLPEPEAVGCVLFGGIVDKAALAQAFCQPLPVGAGKAGGAVLHMAQSFLRELGKTVRRHKGFYVSPLFVANAGTMGRTTSSSLTAHVDFTSGQQRSQATLLDASYSGAAPNKLVRIAVTPSGAGRKRQPVVQHGDAHNILRLGARTFVRELCKGGNVPWAVMRAPSKATVTLEQVAEASLLFDLALSSGRMPRANDAVTVQAAEHYNALVQAFATVLKPALPLMPNNVLEVDPDLIVAPSHCLDEDAGDASHDTDTSNATSGAGDDDEEESEDDDDDEDDAGDEGDEDDEEEDGDDEEESE